MYQVYAKVKTEEQYHVVAKSSLIDGVICSTDVIRMAVKKKQDTKKLFLAFPEIWREGKTAQWEDLFQTVSEKIDGVLIENLDALGYLRSIRYEGLVIAGELLYCYNRESIRFLRSVFPVMWFLAPSELTLAELKQLEKDSSAGFLYKVYGHPKLMVTAQCLYHNYERCGKQGNITLENQKQDRFIVERDCSSCNDLIYYGLPVSMLDKLAEFPSGKLYLDFTIETEDRVREVLSVFQKSLQEPSASAFPFTRGHYYKNID